MSSSSGGCRERRQPVVLEAPRSALPPSRIRLGEHLDTNEIRVYVRDYPQVKIPCRPRALTRRLGVFQQAASAFGAGGPHPAASSPVAAYPNERCKADSNKRKSCWLWHR